MNIDNVLALKAAMFPSEPLCPSCRRPKDDPMRELTIPIPWYSGYSEVWTCGNPFHG